MRSPTGASAAILRAARDGKVTLLVSLPLAIEYEAVCSKPEHYMMAGLTAAQTEIFVTTIMALAEPIETHFLWRPKLRDPDDEMVLETAVNGAADAIVTFNLRGFGQTPREFGVDVWLPRDAIARIRS